MGKINDSEFVKEFKKFISQGSVMDLAVGMVIGAAFTSIVNALVNDIIMPIVGLIIGGVNFSDLSITIHNFFGGNTAAVIRYGSFIQSVVNFLIIAFSLFVVIRAINKINEKAKSVNKRADKAEAEKEEKVEAKEKKEEKAVSDETIKLLKEIRDELKADKKAKK
ncbi:large conductance mechanosensitive channel protein MscL [Candidatus Saccharibacteria bacterium]|nr:large conductance mechanosensitive channel protein MscL [Candidatus Saccharibacteria bacterium]